MLCSLLTYVLFYLAVKKIYLHLAVVLLNDKRVFAFTTKKLYPSEKNPIVIIIMHLQFWGAQNWIYNGAITIIAYAYACSL